MTDAIKLAIDALESVAIALPLNRGTVKTCYAINDIHRDDVHTALAALRARPASQYLCNGTPFKVAVRNGDAMLPYLPDELGGRWVALVAAEDDCHLRAQPDHSYEFPSAPKHHDLIAELRKPMHYLSMAKRNRAADALEGKL